MKRCVKCTLNKTCRQQVPAVMPSEGLPIFFVGEAPGCLLPGQRVLSPNGFTIDDPKGDLISSTGRSQEHTKAFCYDYKGDIIELKTMCGFSLSVTPDHKILCIEPNRCTHGNARKVCFSNCHRYDICARRNGDFKTEWKRAIDVSPNKDWVLIPKVEENNKSINFIDFDSFYSDPRGKSIGKVIIDENFIWILGLFMAEGYARDGLHFSLGAHEHALIQELECKLKKVFPALTITKRVNRSSVVVSLFSRQLAYWAKDSFNEGAINKEVPLFLNDCDNHLISTFIYAWYLGDGNHITNLTRNRNITTASHVAAHQLMYYLLKLGILPIYTTEKCGETSFGPDSISYKIYWRNSDCHKISRKLETHSKRPHIVYYEDNDYFYIPVRSSTISRYSGKVYDITTQDHTYSVPFVIHNSEEDKQGLPFVGEAGRILNKALKEVGIDRKKVAIGNVVRCRPPKNREPLADEFKSCAHHLDRELDKYKPKVIVALGNVPLKRLTKKTGITKLQGTVLETDYGNVIPCIHPAAVLRNPDYYQDIVRVLKRVDDFVAGREEKKTEVKVLVADTLKKVRKVADTIQGVSHLVIDLETTGFSFVDNKILCVALTWSSKFGAIIPLLGQNEEEFWSSEEYGEVKGLLKQIAESPSMKIGHNIKFDMHFCRANGFPLKNVGFDTMLAHYLLDENREHGLKPLALRYTDLGEYDADIKTYVGGKEDSYAAIPNEKLWEYAAKDVICTWLLYRKFEPKIEQNFSSFFNDWVIPTMRLLADAEHKGIRVDPVEAEVMMHTYIERIGATKTKLEKLSAVQECVDFFYQEQLDKLKDHFHNSKTLEKRHTNFSAYVKSRNIEKAPFNFGSPKQLTHLFYNVLGLKIIKRTKKGAPSTDAEVVEHFSKKNPALAAISKYRTLQKWLSTYILPTIGQQDFRVHTTFLIHGTVTGRLASRRPNVQNIPRDALDIRNIYVADPDCYLIQLDYAQAEFRLWGNYAKDENMIADLNAGLDIHKLVASECFGIAFEDVTKVQRQRAKNTVFGIMYGRGPKSIAAEHGFSEEVARHIIKRFFRKYPRAKQWVDHQKLYVKKHGFVKNLFGRVRRLPEVYGSEKEKIAEAFRQCINAPIQSAASDFNCLTSIDVYNNLLKGNSRSYPILWIHDAVVYNIHREELLELIPQIKQIMIAEHPQIVVPMDADIKIGYRYGELKEIADSELVNYA